MATISDDDVGTPTDTWNDVLHGSDEADTLYAGKGQDTLLGGGGIDTFVWHQAFAQVRLQALADGSVQVGAHTLRDIELIRFADVTLTVAEALSSAARQQAATPEADALVGDDLGYLLNGEAGDDHLTGLGGDDALYGGKGQDTAVYRGERSDYRILYDYAAQQYVVEDLRTGRDGTDRLQSVEQVAFADGRVALSAPVDVYSLLPDSVLQHIDGVIGAPASPLAWTSVGMPEVISIVGDEGTLLPAVIDMVWVTETVTFTAQASETASPAGTGLAELVGQPHSANGFQLAEF